MKRKLVAALITATAIGLSGCGKQTLALVSDKVEVELGSELDTNVTSYVELDQKEAAEAAVDFSTVDVMKVGTYTASILYNEESIPFEVVVKDTTAPVVEVKDEVILTVGEKLYAEDVITRVNELSGGVTVAFKEEDASTEAVDGTEMIDATETIDASTEAVDATEQADATKDVAQGEDAVSDTSFVVGDVTCTNAEMTYPAIGEYDTVMIVADASGNSADVLVHVVVGTAPVFNGIEDIAVTTGTEEINYLEGISASDCNGNDLTDKIACDSSAVDLKTAGTYEITYTVTDEDGFQGTAKAAVTVSEGKAGTTKKDTTSKSSDSKKNTATSSDSKKTESASTGKTGGNGSTGNNGNSSGGSNNNSGNGGNSGSGSQTTPDKGSNSNGGGSNNSGNGGNSGSGSQTTPDKGSDSNGGGQTPTPTPAPTPTPTPDPTPAPPDNGNNNGGNSSNENQNRQDQIENDGGIDFDPSTNPDNGDTGDGHWETW